MMNRLPSFPVSSGAYGSQNQWGSGTGSIKSDATGVVKADHSSANGLLNQDQDVKGKGKVGADQKLDLFTIDPARMSGDSFQLGNVDCGNLLMDSLVAGSTTPSQATGISKQSAALQGPGSFIQGNKLSAEAG